LAPFTVNYNTTIDQIGCSVSTGVAAALFKIIVYDSGSNGRPNNLLYESGDLSGAAVAYVAATTSLTFLAGKKYWVGVRHSSTCTLRTVPVAGALQLGLGSSGTAANYATVIRQTVTYANPAPNPFVFAAANLTNNINPPSIRMRIA
jgi:hypothetical protein